MSYFVKTKNMIFRRGKKTVSKNLGRMDKLVTGIIITGAAASILGFSQTKNGKKLSKRLANSLELYGKKGLTIFGKITVRFLSFLKKK